MAALKGGEGGNPAFEMEGDKKKNGSSPLQQS